MGKLTSVMFQGFVSASYLPSFSMVLLSADWASLVMLSAWSRTTWYVGGALGHELRGCRRAAGVADVGEVRRRDDRRQQRVHRDPPERTLLDVEYRTALGRGKKV